VAERRAGPELPELANVLREVTTWADTLRGADVSAERAVLAVLLDRVVPERISRGRYRTGIDWTDLGGALRRQAPRPRPRPDVLA